MGCQGLVPFAADALGLDTATWQEAGVTVVEVLDQGIEKPGFVAFTTDGLAARR
jgi:hypothetical protein